MTQYTQDDKTIFAVIAKSIVPLKKFSDAFRLISVPNHIDIEHFVAMEYAESSVLNTGKELMQYITLTDKGFWAFVNYYCFMAYKDTLLAIGAGAKNKRI